MVGNLKFEPDYKDGRYLCWLLPYLDGTVGYFTNDNVNVCYT